MVKIPKKGTTKEQFKRNFSNRVFYYHYLNKIKPCIIDCDNSYRCIKHWDDIWQDVLVYFFDENWNLYNRSQHISLSSLFETYEEAQKHHKHIERLYKGFRVKPYVGSSILEKHKGQLRYIENEIYKGLKDYPNFEGIDFCDVHAGGIQIRGHHKDIKNYCFGEHIIITIKYNFSNYKETISQFIEMWKAHDNEKFISGYKSFIANCEKYGWD